MKAYELLLKCLEYSSSQNKTNLANEFFKEIITTLNLPENLTLKITNTPTEGHLLGNTIFISETFFVDEDKKDLLSQFINKGIDEYKISKVISHELYHVYDSKIKNNNTYIDGNKIKNLSEEDTKKLYFCWPKEYDARLYSYEATKQIFKEALLNSKEQEINTTLNNVITRCNTITQKDKERTSQFMQELQTSGIVLNEYGTTTQPDNELGK